jgi:hypothetical protein
VVSFRNGYGEPEEKPGRPIENDAPRFRVERTFSRFQLRYRILAVRRERIESFFRDFLDLAFIHIWLKRILVG